jgi:hypothetical protein
MAHAGVLAALLLYRILLHQGAASIALSTLKASANVLIVAVDIDAVIEQAAPYDSCVWPTSQPQAWLASMTELLGAADSGQSTGTLLRPCTFPSITINMTLGQEPEFGRPFRYFPDCCKERDAVDGE